MRRLFASLLVALLGAAVLSPLPAGAAPDTICDGPIGAVEVPGKLVVPANKTCTLLGTTVLGNIVVESGATLFAHGINVPTAGLQATGADLVEITALSAAGSTVYGAVYGGMQITGGRLVTLSDTSTDGTIQIKGNSDRVSITNLRTEAAPQLSENTGGVLVQDSLLGEGIEIVATGGDVTFTGNEVDESTVTITKTTGDVTVDDNLIGENLVVAETSGHVSVQNNTISDNAEVANNSGGAPVSRNQIGDNVEILEAGGDVTFTGNTVEGSATIAKTTGTVTADDNKIGQSLSPDAEEKPSGGSLEVVEASGRVSVQNNTVSDNAEVANNWGGATVSGNQIGDTLSVSKITGGTEISNNRAAGNIDCIDNAPPPTGTGNVAGTDGQGFKTGQCAEL